METESGEVHKMIHEGAEVYLNGIPLGNGEVEYEVETPYEKIRSGEWGLGFQTVTNPTKRTFKITMPEGSHAPQGDWIIKRYTPDGNIKEETFGDQEDKARSAMQLFQDFGLEGHFELVCRPRVEDVVVTSYRNEPEKEEPGSPGFFDESKQYIDRDGDVWSCRESWWSFNRPGAGSSIGSFRQPVAGPFKVLEGDEDLDKSEQLTQSFDMSKTYIDKDGDKWKWREDKDSDHLGEWVCYHRLDEDELTWEPIPPVTYGPYAEEDE